MSKFNPKLDLSALNAQFAGLRGRHPGLWPTFPKAALLAGLVAVVLGAAYIVQWRGQLDELDTQVQEEDRLKLEFASKMKQAVNLAVLREQKEQVSRYVGQLEKQLPSKAEMDALLSDINQAGVGRGLQFELFRPGQVVVKDYYAELPIAIKLSGNYHDFGAFTSDIANLPRIVTLNNMQIVMAERAAGASAPGSLTMEAIAKTYRYLDAEEIAQQRRQAAAAKAGKSGNDGSRPMKRLLMVAAAIALAGCAQRTGRVARVDAGGAREHAASARAHRRAQALRAVPLRQRRRGRPVLDREDGRGARQRAEAQWRRTQARPESPARSARVASARLDQDGRAPDERATAATRCCRSTRLFSRRVSATTPARISD